jgi:GrpB-like predicted nucleotidyltransferase (UPF0157 family)
MSNDVILMPHNPRWAEKFEAESAMVMAAVGDSAIAVHHIGSTAIASVVAKPIIDMLMVVQSIQDIDSRNGDLEKLDYERTFHLHVYGKGNPQITRHLAFRDFLRANPEYAAEYSNLKLRLARQFPHSSQEYIAGKEPLIRKIDELAAGLHQ